MGRCRVADVEIPDVEYARSGDVAIAYQVVGEGGDRGAHELKVPGEWKLYADHS
jgi:hypothetical protein